MLLKWLRTYYVLRDNTVTLLNSMTGDGNSITAIIFFWQLNWHIVTVEAPKILSIVLTLMARHLRRNEWSKWKGRGRAGKDEVYVILVLKHILLISSRAEEQHLLSNGKWFNKRKYKKKLKIEIIKLLDGSLIYQSI